MGRGGRVLKRTAPGLELIGLECVRDRIERRQAERFLQAIGLAGPCRNGTGWSA